MCSETCKGCNIPLICWIVFNMLEVWLVINTRHSCNLPLCLDQLQCMHITCHQASEAQKTPGLRFKCNLKLPLIPTQFHPCGKTYPYRHRSQVFLNSLRCCGSYQIYKAIYVSPKLNSLFYRRSFHNCCGIMNDQKHKCMPIHLFVFTTCIYTLCMLRSCRVSFCKLSLQLVIFIVCVPDCVFHLFLSGYQLVQLWPHHGDL